MEVSTILNEAVSSESSPVTESQAQEVIKTETTTNEVKTGSILENALSDNKVEDNQSKETDSKEAEKEIEYQDFKLPEGISLDENVAKEFKATAKELKLNQDQAQKLIDLQTKHVQEMNERIMSDFNKQVNSWKEETLKELGPSLKEDQAYIAKVVKQFGSTEFTNLLNQTGLGNNKEVVKFLINVGKNFSDDKFIDGKRGHGEEESMAKKLYPSMK